MSSLKVVSNQWERPQTSVYENNFGYAVNFYQPMIDYLDEKRYKGNAKYPHLPYTDERALPPYDPARKIVPYTDDQIQELAKDTDRIVRKLGTKRVNVLQKSASAANVSTSNISTSNVCTSNVSTSVSATQGQEVVLRKTIRKSRQVVSANLESNVSTAKPPANPLRGKSAKAIEGLILQQTEQNLDKQRQLERSKSALELPTKSFKQVLEEKLKNDNDDDIFKSLSSVKDDLVGFCKRNFMQVTDQRYF